MIALRTTIYLFAFAILAHCVFALPVQAQPKQGAETFIVPFVPERNHGGPLVQALINGKLTGTFLIDTGSSACFISKSFAKRLGLRTSTAYLGGGVLQARFGDLNQVQEATKVDSLVLGDLRLTGAPFIVLSDDEFFESEQPFDGIIGGPVMSQFAIFIDFPRQFLAFITTGKLSTDERAKMGLAGASPIPLSEPQFAYDYETPLDNGNPDPGTGGPPVQSAIERQGEVREWTYTTPVEISNSSRSAKENPTIDTGSPITSIPYGAAAQLSINATDYFGTQTMFNGSGFYNVGTVDQFKMGDLALSSIPVEFPSSKQIDIPPLIGEDILSYGIALFDFPAKTLYFKPTMPPIADVPAAVDPNGVLVDRLKAAAGDLWLFPGKGLASSSPFDDDDVAGEIASIMAKTKGDSSDAPLIVKIAGLLQDEGKGEAAQAQFAKAADLWTAQLKTTPSDPKAQAGLALALAAQGKVAEAEKMAQAETVQLPNEPAGWVALAQVLDCKADLEVTGSVFSPHTSDHNYASLLALVSRLESSPPDRATLAAEKADTAQARTAIDKAVALAPNDPAMYLARAELVDDIEASIDDPIAQARAGVTDLLKAPTPDQVFKDYDQAAALSTDPHVVDRAIMADIDDAMSRPNKIDYRRSFFWKSLAKDVRSRIQAHIDHLSELSKSKDEVAASAAQAELGSVQFNVEQDETAAEVTLKGVIAGRPDSGTAVDALDRMLSSDERYDDLIADVMQVDSDKQTAQIHMALARCYLREQKFDLAVKETRLAIALKPNSFICNLYLAGLLMRNPNAGSANMGEAKACLDRAKTALGGDPGRTEADALSCELSIFQALTGNVNEAVHGLVAVLQSDRRDTQARGALASLLM